MLRGAVGGSRSRRPRPPSSPAPSRRAAQAAPESRKVSVLEDPVVSAMEETSFTFEFKRGPKRAKKAMPTAEAHRGKRNSREGLTNITNVVPGKIAATKEGPKEVDFAHCTPSIVARLMGLDTVPRPKKVLDRCQSDIQSNVQRHLSNGVHVTDTCSSEDQPCSRSSDELPELKDVFEVTEMENMAMCMPLRSGNEEPCPRSSESDLEFVRRKFLDAKRLSTDESHRNSKEFGEALEILYSKKDAFLEILEENSNALSGFPGHSLGQSGSQRRPHTSKTTAAKLFDQDHLRSMEVESDRLFHVPDESENPIHSMHLKETSGEPLEPLAPNRNKRRGSGHRARIVVLKPNIQNRSFTHVLSSEETTQSGQRSTCNSLSPPRHNMYMQYGMHSMPLNYDEVVEPRGDAPEQKGTKQTAKIGARRKPSQRECPRAIGSERAKVTSTSFDDTVPIIFPSTHSVGSSVSRTARKHISERWQMACQPDAEISMPKDTITLGEMLELSGRDATKGNTHKISSNTNSDHNNVQEVPGCPVGISSKDGWKTGIYCKDGSRGGTSRNFSRSKSLPASSTNGATAKLPGRKQSAPTCNLPILKDILNAPTDEYGNLHARNRSQLRKTKQKNGRSIFHSGNGNMIPEKEIHVTSEKARHSICTSDLSRASNTHKEHHNGVIITGDHQASDCAVLHSDEQKFQNSKDQMEWTEKKVAPSLPETKEDISIHNQDDIALKEGRSQLVEIDIAEMDPQPIQSSHIVSLESGKCSSPAASLQEISEQETAYSGIFKGISDGILGLRMQLKMLKMDDQDDNFADDPYMFSSDEFADMDISTYEILEEHLPVFKDEEDRDFTYTYEMLDAAFDSLVYPEDCQVSSDVFIWLEEKYSKLLLWSKSDRRLLFDLVNSILADMTALGSSLHSNIMMKRWAGMDQRELAENVWEKVLLIRSYEPFDLDSVEALPLDHHSELEAVGTEIAKMIHDDILEESVAEFMSQLLPFYQRKL